MIFRFLEEKPLQSSCGLFKLSIYISINRPKIGFLSFYLLDNRYYILKDQKKVSTARFARSFVFGNSWLYIYKNNSLLFSRGVIKRKHFVIFRKNN